MDTHERDARRRQRRLLDAREQEQRRQGDAARRLAASAEQRWRADFVRGFLRSLTRQGAPWRWN
jgi:hypothetical protein